eukprot:TRINITY_DN1699_c0_g1_i1.p1 TRINITY_DN1699_c0_g1~~TRINITY_DN1699_c0_g1_i1.p1  ORF type:complete len:110 (+),score=11.95 TRINITY_DN1699_c0_g1_i1:24-353(+)
MVSLSEVLGEFFTQYHRQPHKLRIIDVFMVFAFLTGVIQFIYVCIVGTFPFNSFLSGFISTVGTFVLLASLRMQVNPKNKFEGISEERAFADFIFCNVIFHLAVINFMG